MISFILIMMSVQNVDKHLEISRTCCCICAKKLGKRARKTNAQLRLNLGFRTLNRGVPLKEVRGNRYEDYMNIFSRLNFVPQNGGVPCIEVS